MKRTLLSLGATALLATGAFAQIDDLMRRDRLSETEAASAVAIARGLGLRLDYVVRVKRELGTQMWNLGPVFYISERSNIDPRTVWQEHRRGAGWMELDRNRGRDYIGRRGDDYGYGTPPPRRGDDDYRYEDERYENERYREGGFGDYRNQDRYDDAYRNRRGGLSDIIDDILGRRDDDDYYRNNRTRYGRQGDRQYEQRVWDEILKRAHGHGVNRTWRYLDRGLHIGDIALASHVARVARTQPERVLDELIRNRNWRRVREHFGIADDWETRDRYRNENRGRGQGQGRNRDILDDIFEIIR